MGGEESVGAIADPSAVGTFVCEPRAREGGMGAAPAASRLHLVCRALTTVRLVRALCVRRCTAVACGDLPLALVLVTAHPAAAAATGFWEM